MLSKRVIYREHLLGMWAAASIPWSSAVEWREATRTNTFFFCHMASMRWTALPCHHGLKSLQPSANRNLPFLKLSPRVFITVKKRIWLQFGHHIEKWWVLKEVLETCGWSLSPKKCAELWSLVLWLPGVRWESFISNTFLPLVCITRYHREGSHCNRWGVFLHPWTFSTLIQINDLLLQVAGV